MKAQRTTRKTPKNGQMGLQEIKKLLYSQGQKQLNEPAYRAEKTLPTAHQIEY